MEPNPVCAECGKPLEVKRSQKRYCSITCRHKAWKARTGGIAARSDPRLDLFVAEMVVMLEDPLRVYDWPTAVRFAALAAGIQVPDPATIAEMAAGAAAPGQGA